MSAARCRSRAVYAMCAIASTSGTTFWRVMSMCWMGWARYSFFLLFLTAMIALLYDCIPAGAGHWTSPENTKSRRGPPRCAAELSEAPAIADRGGFYIERLWKLFGCGQGGVSVREHNEDHPGMRACPRKGDTEWCAQQ